MSKSITDTISLYFNTDIHNQFNEWFTEFSKLQVLINKHQ